MRTARRFLVLALAACAIAAVPASARGDDARPDSIAAPDSTPSVQLAFVAPAESIHVYLLTQLAVSKELAQDSAAVQALIRHAVVTIMVGLTAEQIDVASGMVFIRDANAGRAGANGPSASRGNRALILAGTGRSDRRLRQHSAADAFGRTSAL